MAILTNPMTGKYWDEGKMFQIIEHLKDADEKIGLFEAIAAIAPPPEWDLEEPEHAIPSPYFILTMMISKGLENELPRLGKVLRPCIEVLLKVWNLQDGSDDKARFIQYLQEEIINRARSLGKNGHCIWQLRVQKYIKDLVH